MNALIFIVFSTGFLFLPFCEAASLGAVLKDKDMCIRQPYPGLIGYEAMDGDTMDANTSKPIELDVGECIRREALFSTRLSSEPSEDCAPYAITKEHHLFFDRITWEFDIILSCQAVPSTCQRIPRMATFYPGTSFSREVDVGACGGLCRDNITCTPFKKRMMAISSPEGERYIEVIVDCSCVTAYCYRETAIGGFVEQYTDANGKTANRTKFIDVGKCVGSDRCSKDSRPSATEAPFLRPSKPQCSAKTTRTQSYVAPGGRQVEVAIIDSCDCD